VSPRSRRVPLVRAGWCATPFDAMWAVRRRSARVGQGRQAAEAGHLGQDVDASGGDLLMPAGGLLEVRESALVAATGLGMAHDQPGSGRPRYDMLSYSDELRDFGVVLLDDQSLHRRRELCDRSLICLGDLQTDHEVHPPTTSAQPIDVLGEFVAGPARSQRMFTAPERRGDLGQMQWLARRCGRMRCLSRS